MITTLEKAKKLLGIDDTDTSKDFEIEEKLKSLEITIRNLTNNKFLDGKIKNLTYNDYFYSDTSDLTYDEFLAYGNLYSGVRSRTTLKFDSASKTITGDDFMSRGFRAGNTIDIDECLLNKGIFTIVDVTNSSMTVSEDLFDEESYSIITKVVYPYDIVQGVIKLINYDFKMGSKIGVKQESIARYSVTYYDVNNTESIEGYPAALMKFLNKYKKLRWS